MRDLQRDKEICEAATPGPVKWQKFGGEYYLAGQYDLRPIILATIDVENQRGFGSVTHISNRNQENDLLYPLDPKHPDSRFIEESWQGWPHAIDRALTAEARTNELSRMVDALTAENNRLRAGKSELRIKLATCNQTMEAAESMAEELGDKLAEVMHQNGEWAKRCYAADDRIKDLETALDKIANPIGYVRAEAEAEGMFLDGHMVLALAKDHSYLQGIARKALMTKRTCPHCGAINHSANTFTPWACHVCGGKIEEGDYA